MMWGLSGRMAEPRSGANDSRLASIDITTGISTDLPAGPGVKINPSPLPGNDVGFVRKDGGAEIGSQRLATCFHRHHYRHFNRSARGSRRENQSFPASRK